MTVREVLVPALEAAFPGRGLLLSASSDPVAVIPATSPEIGDVLIYADGDEATIVIKSVTDHRVAPPRADATEEERVRAICEGVVRFLSDLFSDEVFLWRRSGFGGCRRRRPDEEFPSELPSEAEVFVWSGRIARPGVVSRHGMMDPLLSACPSFRPVWEEFVAEWEDEGTSLPITLALGDLARHLVGMLERGETGSFPQIFSVVERWLREGDDYVENVATVGLLEGLQNTNLHEGATRPEEFRRFLGPESERWWDKLYGFWERGKPLTDD